MHFLYLDPISTSMCYKKYWVRPFRAHHTTPTRKQHAEMSVVYINMYYRYTPSDKKQAARSIVIPACLLVFVWLCQYSTARSVRFLHSN